MFNPGARSFRKRDFQALLGLLPILASGDPPAIHENSLQRVRKTLDERIGDDALVEIRTPEKLRVAEANLLF